MILSKEQARAHERKGRRLLFLATMSTVAMIAGGSLVPALALIVLPVFLYFNVFLFLYVLRDLQLRGSSPAWAFVPGFGLFVWLMWRRWHPLRIREW